MFILQFKYMKPSDSLSRGIPNRWHDPNKDILFAKNRMGKMKVTWEAGFFLFCFGNISYWHALGERKITYYFISCSTISRGAVKLTLFPTDVDLSMKGKN